ncbi:MAG TPA: gamma-glutamyltransferase, partial [Gemmatimonadaceae bacterium]|nr:gamma-glutamyltransferase [Gemmatimonadaceae bacterium]
MTTRKLVQRTRWTLPAVLTFAVVSFAAAPVASVIDDPAIPPRVPAVFPNTWRFPAGAKATFAEHALVASDSRIASEVGAQIMKEGGNAVDAAVATGFALAVAYPEAGNLGGGGYMVIRMADGRVAALDYRETAPLSATRDMYVGGDGKLNGESVVGPKASGVPGAVAGMLEAHRKFGVLPLT